MLVMSISFVNAQDTITGWTFPVNVGTDSLNANLGLPSNAGYDLRFEGTDTTYSRIYFTPNAPDYAATASGWDNGANTKFWSIKFKANGYTNIKVSSKQKSDNVNLGPQDFKLQWRITGGTYADIPGGTVTVADNWTSGVVNNLAVPVTNQGTSSVYICWIMTSNFDINGGTVTPAGVTMIDDIIVTGTAPVGMDEILYTNRINLFPNPSNGSFQVSSTAGMESISVINAQGAVVSFVTHPQQITSMNLDLPEGAYFLKVKFDDVTAPYLKKFVIE